MRPPAKWILLLAIVALCGTYAPAPAYEGADGASGPAFDSSGEHASEFVAWGPSTPLPVLGRPGPRPPPCIAFARFFEEPRERRMRRSPPPEPKVGAGLDLPLAVVVVELLI